MFLPKKLTRLLQGGMMIKECNKFIQQKHMQTEPVKIYVRKKKLNVTI